jgi:hypothetical protein
MSEDLRGKKDRLLRAAEKAVDELINVLNDPIINNSDDDISADKMKNAAAAKRLAFEDALFILDRIDSERSKFQDTAIKIIDTGNGGFAEGRAKSSGKK